MSIYKQAKAFKDKYPLTIAWRLKKNSKIVEKYLDKDEEIKYVFVGQKNNKFYDFFSTAVIALTNKRILVGRKRVVWGHFLNTISPEMYNDLSVRAGLVWGKVLIDTVKEIIVISNVDKEALPEINNLVSQYMLEYRKKPKEKESNKK